MHIFGAFFSPIYLKGTTDGREDGQIEKHSSFYNLNYYSDQLIQCLGIYNTIQYQNSKFKTMPLPTARCIKLGGETDSSIR